MDTTSSLLSISRTYTGLYAAWWLLFCKFSFLRTNMEISETSIPSIHHLYRSSFEGHPPPPPPPTCHRWTTAVPKTWWIWNKISELSHYYALDAFPWFLPLLSVNTLHVEWWGGGGQHHLNCCVLLSFTLCLQIDLKWDTMGRVWRYFHPETQEYLKLKAFDTTIKRLLSGPECR